MRRFELVEGTSNKFWQVGVDNDALRIQFGKIGSNGQVQLKKLPDAAAAAAEAERLIREKTKKGYVEIPTLGATSTSALGKPSAGSADASVDLLIERFVWTDEARATAKERAARLASPVPAISETKVLARLKGSFAELATSKAWTSGAWSSECAVHRDRIAATWAKGKAPATFDPIHEAATVALAEVDEQGTVVASWLQRGGTSGALRALGALWAFDTKRDVLIMTDPATHWDSTHNGGKNVVRMLRSHFDTLEPSEREEAIEVARELRKGACLPVRVGISRVVRHPAWTAEDADALLSAAANHFDAWPLVNDLRERERLERFVARFGVEEVEAHEIAWGAQLEAQSVLDSLVLKASHRDAAIDSAVYLATLETIDTARTFAQVLDKKGLAARAKAFFARRPDLGLAALASIVAAGGKLSVIGEPAARALIDAHPELPGSLRPHLDPKAQRALDGMAPAAEASAVATRATGATRATAASDLPAVLVSPPWLGANAEPPPSVATLKALTFSTELHFSAAERKALSEPAIDVDTIRRWYSAPTALVVRSAAMDNWAMQKLARGADGAFFASWLHLMTDEGAMRVLTGMDLAGFRLDADDLRYVLARFDVAALPSVIAAGGAATVAAARALEHVEAPEVAVFYGEAMARSKQARPRALAYFARYPEASAIALVPLALDKKTQKVGFNAIHALARAGAKASETIVAVARRYGEKAEQATRAVLAYDPYALSKPPAMPPLFDPKRLPAIALRGGGTVPIESMPHLGSLLAMSEARTPHPLLESVKSACTPESLAAFAWALFQAWLSTGGEPKSDWAFTALGHLGTDDTARKLAPLVRTWPGEGAHARAVKGLDVFAQMGSDLALMLLDGIAEKIKFKGLQEKAREKIDEVANERGLSRDELADRIAPRLDLDDDGSRTLSFGSRARAFRVGFDEHLAPFVLDADGKRLADLPKPSKSDDAGTAAEAIAAWKILKKDAKAVASSQLHRLERAMCTSRRWTADEFLTLLVQHPLVGHMARRLLWALYDVKGSRTALFRIAEDRTLAGVDDEPLDLRAIASATELRVGLPHRLELDAASLQAWGSIFADYAIVQPFAQLDRSVFVAAAADMKAIAIASVEGATVPTGRLIGLEAKGWRKGTAQDGGWIWDMYKPLERGLFAVLAMEEGGLLVGAMGESPPSQKLGAVVISKNQYGGEPLAIGALSALAYSELLRDLEDLRNA